MGKGWYGNRQQHSMASKGVRTSASCQRKQTIKDARRMGRGDPQSLFYDPNVINEEFEASGVGRVFDTDTSRMLGELSSNQEDYSYERDKLLDTIIKLEDKHHFLQYTKDIKGKYYRDYFLEDDVGIQRGNVFIHELYENFYNLKHPFKKGDEVWDEDKQTWFYINHQVNEYSYSGHYYDQNDNSMKSGVSWYDTLRRSNDEV